MAKRKSASGKKTNSKYRSRTTRGGDLVNSPSPYVRRAAGLSAQGQHLQALAELETALRREPDNIRVYVTAAKAYADQYRFDRMREIHQALIRRAPDHPGVYHLVGESMTELKWPAEAIASFEHAVSLPGALPDTHLELAGLYERSNRLDEAKDRLQLARRQGFSGPPLALIEARLQSRQGNPEGAEQTLLDVIRTSDAENGWTCQAWGLIALIRDQRGEYGGAVEAIEHCKQFQRSISAKQNLLKVGPRKHLQKMIDDLSMKHFNKWRDQAAKFDRQRVAMLTGFPRSGTTLIEQVLDAHPDAVSSEERDYLGKFVFAKIRSEQENSSVLQSLDNLARNRILYERERYLGVMEAMLGQPITSRMHIDKNPAYNLVIPLLLRIFPEAKLLIAIRDPRDVFISCFLRYLPLNPVSASFLTPDLTVDRYLFDMRAWLDLRGIVPDCWCEVRYEDTVADVEWQARRVTGALGLAWDPNVLNYRQRLVTDKHVNSPTYDAVTKPIYKGAVGRWKNYQKFFSLAFDRLSKISEDLGYN